MDQKDLEAINTILGRLVGQPCWRVSFSYGDELRIDFGEEMIHVGKGQSQLTWGSWILGTRASYWELAPNGKPAPPPEHPDSRDYKVVVQVMVDTVVTHARLIPTGLILEVTFSNGHILRVYPDPDAPEDDICDWELFIPDKKMLQVGPHDQWVLRDSTKPMSKSD